MYQYNYEFPTLAKQAENTFYRLKMGKMWPVGGMRFKQLAKFIGLKNALRITRIISL